MDSILARVMPGELIVPTAMVRAGVADHLRGHLPGFAAGGIVPSYGGQVAGLQPWAAHNRSATITAITAGVARSMASSFRAMFAAPGGHAGAGVQQWRGLVLRALGMEGLSPLLAGRVLYQMQTESGGNPNAINLTDSNARAGDPSRGLLQTIGSTFSAYHWPGTSWNIFNPFANIAAAINYARHTYGPLLESGGMGMGSGRGYDHGGWLDPGFTLAFNGTGQRERVLPPGKRPREAPLVEIHDQHIHEESDISLLAHKLSFAVTAASLGS
jgi:SLT domain-containing protein